MIAAMDRRRSEPLSTCTVTRDGHLVPWLAADGPLAYSPEAPPERDYYFKYGWVLPSILSEHARPRRPYIFGAQRKDDAAELLAFWQQAREGMVERVACCLGTDDVDTVTAPVAVYRTSIAPLSNIRITSFFAGEHEARIIDPKKIDILAARGCRAVPVEC
jgi:hypothetical protein